MREPLTESKCREVVRDMAERRARTGGRRRHARAHEQRIQAILATGIPEARCQCINLGFVDYRGIDLVGAEPSLAARVQPGAY